MQEKLDLSKSQGASTSGEVKYVQRVPYASPIESIIYAVRCTRSDGLNPLSHRLKPGKALPFQETDNDDRKSQSGYVFVLNGGAVDSKSAKQSTIAMSSIEAEYITALEAAMEVVWTRKFIIGLGVVPTKKEPVEMLCDNTDIISIVNEPNITK
ncbi:hypothetical protein Tco_0990807 [Tanacetum coccineum]|uniref:Uncharacterized protein n=1 Tax=Tanacetum coccineum TaxID=301880 RepID=A0ABQ5EXJ2_9ASTR